MSDVQVLWSWHHRLHIWAILLVTRGSAIAALPWMLDLWSSRRTVFFFVKTGSSRWIISSAYTCASVVMSFFETVLLDVWRPLSLILDFRSLSLFTDVVFMYADTTLETLALDTPNNVADFSQMFQLNAHQQSALFRNWTNLLFSHSFTTTATQHNH
jgi:hypothetical protein